MSTFVCAHCGSLFEDKNPHYNDRGVRFLCLDCALKLGKCTPMEYLDAHGLGIYHHAEYNNGKIIAYQKWGRGYRKDELEVFR